MRRRPLVGSEHKLGNGSPRPVAVVLGLETETTTIHETRGLERDIGWPVVGVRRGGETVASMQSALWASRGAGFPRVTFEMDENCYVDPLARGG